MILNFLDVSNPPEKANEFRFVFTHAIGSSSIFNSSMWTTFLCFQWLGNSHRWMLKSSLITLIFWLDLGCPQHTSTTFIRWDQLSSLATDAISIQCDGVNAMALCHLQSSHFFLAASYRLYFNDELPRATFGIIWLWNVSELHISSSTFAARCG